MTRAFIVRPFNVKEGINFETVDEVLIQPALKAAGLEGATTANIAQAGNIREDMFRLLVTADLVMCRRLDSQRQRLLRARRPSRSPPSGHAAHACRRRRAIPSICRPIASCSTTPRSRRRRVGEARRRDHRHARDRSARRRVPTARSTRCCRACRSRARRRCAWCLRISARRSTTPRPRIGARRSAPAGPRGGMDSSGRVKALRTVGRAQFRAGRVARCPRHVRVAPQAAAQGRRDEPAPRHDLPEARRPRISRPGDPARDRCAGRVVVQPGRGVRAAGT